MGKHQYDEDDDEHLEKFVKIRRKSTNARDLAELRESFELGEKDWHLKPKDQRFAARVVEVHKRYAFVSTEATPYQINTHDVWLATLARKYMVARRAERNLVCVGDRVLCCVSNAEKSADGLDLPQCVIQHMVPRRSKLSRLDPSFVGRTQVIASNIDMLVIVASFKNPRLSWGLIDRYLVLAESEGLEAVLILNKNDLLKETDLEFQQECEERLNIYRNLGYTVLQMQANESDANVSEAAKILEKKFKKKMSVICGHSGVGKSSVINLYRPEIVQAVEPDSDIFYKGRHTTTFASLIKLGTGGYVIDTPGVRSFALRGLGAIELSHAFRDMREARQHCKYRECRHIDEPECAVLAAVAAGQISSWRYKSYTSILLGEGGREGRLREIETT